MSVLFFLTGDTEYRLVHETSYKKGYFHLAKTMSWGVITTNIYLILEPVHQKFPENNIGPFIFFQVSSILGCYYEESIMPLKIEIHSINKD